VDWVKPIAELLKALAHFAWPISIAIIVWWFRAEIKIFIERGFDFEGFGVKIKAAKEAKEALEIIRATTTSEGAKKAQEPQRLLEKAAAEITSSDGVALMELALTDPRQAVQRSFYLMARAIIGKAFDPAPTPVDSVLDTAIQRLTARGILNDRLLLQIRALRKFHHSVRNGYAPTTDEAAQFVFSSTAVREDLGDKTIEK
jgi:hypothetical protein